MLDKQPLTPMQVRQALAAIKKGHQLEGQQASASAMDRARRILTGELSPEGARLEMQIAIQKVIDRERDKLR